MPPSILNLKVIFKDKKGQNWYFGFIINLDHNQYIYPNKLFYFHILAPNQCTLVMIVMLKYCVMKHISTFFSKHVFLGDSIENLVVSS